MSLHPQEHFPVPEGTRRVAQAAFPNLISKILQPAEANEQGVLRWSRRRRADGGEGNRDESVG